jgi:hypothetical protein
MIAKHLDNKLKRSRISKAKAKRKNPDNPITKLAYRLLDRDSSLTSRQPSYKQLVAKFQVPLREDPEGGDDNLENEEVDDDVFEDEESGGVASTTNHVVVRSHPYELYRHLLGFVSLRKIWNILLRYIWTSHSCRSIAAQPASPSRKVVELEDSRTQLTTLDSDSEGEDLFQDCEEEKESISDTVNFCFSPPAPSFLEALNRPLSSLLLRYDAIFTPTPATPLTFTPATIQSNSSAQSSASNRARLADLSWDNYDLTMLPQSPLEGGEVFGSGRWSALPRSQRIPMASCLKTLWSLESPSYDQLAGSPIAEDIEEEDDEGINSTTNSIPIEANTGEHRFTQIETQKSLEVIFFGLVSFISI